MSNEFSMLDICKAAKVRKIYTNNHSQKIFDDLKKDEIVAEIKIETSDMEIDVFIKHDIKKNIFPNGLNILPDIKYKLILNLTAEKYDPTTN